MIGYIYKYENILNHKVYIGQTINLSDRRASHKHKSLYIKNKFYNAVRKYGWDKFDYAVIAQVEANSLDKISELLDDLEIKYIEQYNSYYHGYNSTLGGHSARGKIMPESFIDYCKHRTYSKETRQKMSDSAKRRVSTLEWKQKKKLYCEQHKDKLIEQAKNAAMAKCKPVLQFTKDGFLVNEFESLISAARYVHSTIEPSKNIAALQKCINMRCKGKVKKKLYYGFEWKFKTDV